MDIRLGQHNLIANLVENRENEQFFFTLETTLALAERIRRKGKVACLSTPSIFNLLADVHPDSYLFEIDDRILEEGKELYPERVMYLNFEGNPSVQAWRNHIETIYPHHGTFDGIVVDPPFDTIDISMVFQTINYLFDYANPDAEIIMVHQLKRFPMILQAAVSYGLSIEMIEDLAIQFQRPPRRHVSGKNPIVAFSIKKQR